jgi:sulfoxide reductase heme-binding subunit YedZ
VITWIVLRAAGIGAYLMLFGAVAWGMVATTAAVGKRVAKATSISIHQFLSTVGLMLLGVHMGLLAVDRFMPFKPIDLLVPFHGPFRPVAVAFGVMAMYAMVVVLVSSWIRKKLSTKVWRAIHLLAVPAFTMAMVHGIFAGTDTVRPWMWWTYVATAATVLFLLIVRGLTAGLRAARAERPAHARPVDRPARPATDVPGAAGTERPHRPTHPQPSRPRPAPVPAASQP